MAKFVKSQRRADHLIYKGFRYRKNGAGSTFAQSGVDVCPILAVHFRKVQGESVDPPQLPGWLPSDLVRGTQPCPRPNNMIEGWHRGIQASLDGDHPSIWQTIKFLQIEETAARTSMAQLVAGREIGKERREQILRTRQLLHIMQDYGNRNLMAYLTGVAQNFSLNV